MSPERGPEGTPLGLAAPETVQGAARSQLRPPRAPRTVTLQAARQAPGARRSKQVPIHRPNEEGAEPLEVQLSQQGLDERHAENFLECIRTRKQPNCTARMGHRSAQTSILATRAYVNGQVVRFDPEK